MRSKTFLAFHCDSSFSFPCSLFNYPIPYLMAVFRETTPVHLPTITVFREAIFFTSFYFFYLVLFTCKRSPTSTMKAEMAAFRTLSSTPASSNRFASFLFRFHCARMPRMRGMTRVSSPLKVVNKAVSRKITDIGRQKRPLRKRKIYLTFFCEAASPSFS